MIALPMPSRQNDTSMIVNDAVLCGIGMVSTGSSNASAVTTRLISTVLRRPIRFISRPVGTEKIRNHRNTISGNSPAMVSDSPKSFLMKFVPVPTRSTKLIAKNESMIGTSFR